MSFLRRALPLVACLAGLGAADPALAPDDAFVRPQGENLTLAGKPVRFWGFIGPTSTTGFKWAPAPSATDTPEVKAQKVAAMNATTDFYIKRIKELGFDLVRTWERCDWTATWQAGDGSVPDQLGYYWAALDRAGIRQWWTAGNHLGGVSAEDAERLAPGEEGRAFREAIDELIGAAGAKAKAKAKGDKRYKGGTVDIRGAYYEYWDEHLQAIHLERLTQAATWRNHHKPGSPRLCDDPQIVVWELANEEWWMKKMVTGVWQKLPAYFQASLQARWHAFLKERYGDDAGLAKAWGTLAPGESLASKVAIAPLASASKKAVNDANAAAVAALQAGAEGQSITLENAPRQRGADVLEFFTAMHLAWKKKQYDHLKSLGKGPRLAAVIMDTGEGYRAQNLLLHQAGDASAMCTYLDGRPKSEGQDQSRLPWYSYLQDPPVMAKDRYTPWIEWGSLPGKPMFWYETNTNLPGKYRAEYPYQVAALASIQNASIVCWHTFPRTVDPATKEGWYGQLYLSNPQHGAAGFEYRHDEVLIAGIVNAGHIWKQGLLKPAAQPTVITWGRSALFDPASMPYGGSFGEQGKVIPATAWAHGLRMRGDMAQTEYLKADGPTVLANENPVRSTPEIEWDFKKQHLRFDAPAAAAYTGFLANYGGPLRFAASNAELTQVRIANPEGLFDPVREDEQYIAFSAVAEDGKPLAESASIRIALVSTSQNTGFRLNKDTATTKEWNVGPNISFGKVPVLVARVGGVLSAPWLKGLKWRALDFNLKELATGTLTEGKLEISEQQPVFCVVLER